MKSSVLSKRIGDFGDERQGFVRADHKNKKMKKGKDVRNWADLPADALSIVFEKIGVYDIVYRAQFVCSAWRNLSKQPHLFRILDLKPPRYLIAYPFNEKIKKQLVKIQKQILDRSCGQFVSLSLIGDEVAHYALDSPKPLLKTLSLRRISAKGLMEVIPSLPLVEELTLSVSFSSTLSSQKQLVDEICRSCVQLKYFCWDSPNPGYARLDDEEVLAIAENMRHLRHLRLAYNRVTNKELLAILCGCPYLEHLDLELCYGMHYLSEEILSKCRTRIRTFRPPSNDYDYNDRGSDTDYDWERDCDDGDEDIVNKGWRRVKLLCHRVTCY